MKVFDKASLEYFWRNVKNLLADKAPLSHAHAYADQSLSNVNLSKLLGSTGYYKAPDGLMIQWGRVTPSAGVPNTTTQFVPSFTSVYSVVCGSETISAAGGIISTMPYTITNSYFISKTKGITLASLADETIPFRWIAIGTWK